ncbi:MAG: pilus assembly PilX N-terminal domain-containing protein [Gemmatimonadales bacterium]|jgi:hypothetical protein
MIGYQMGHRRLELAGRDGFVLPVVIFGLVIMSTLAVAALLTAGDEQKSAQAVLESASAFYAAEAGFNELWAAWPDTQVSGLEPGDTLDLGWQALDHGASYRAVVYRLDNGGQKMYQLTVEGRGGGPLGGQRMLGLTIAADPGGPGGAGTLPPWEGTGAITGRGGWAASGNVAGIDGHDSNPPNWDNCPADSMVDAPGVVWDDKSKVETGNGGQIKGVPPIVENPELADDDVYWQFGDLTFDDLVAMAAYTISNTGDMGFGTKPKTNFSGECVEPWSGSNWMGGVDYNMGSDNPSNPCYDYFPIVHLTGKNTLSGMSGGYAQGIFLVEGNFQLVQNARFRGLIIAKGCVTMGNGGSIYGAVLVDNTGGVSGCGGGGFMIGNASQSYWSSCAVRRTLENAGVDFGLGDEGEGFRLLGSRSFSEMLR